jgi:hypothetical protein
MKRILPLAAATCLLLLVPARGETHVEVRILDAPRHAYTYEPVFVTIEVRNHGRAPVVIPTGSCSTEGVSLRVGQVGQELEDWSKVSDCAPEGVVWLISGARWLFFYHVAFGPEGEFEIEAVLRSPGECGGRPVGPDRHRIERQRPIVFQGRLYDCWFGVERSDRFHVVIEIPTHEADLAAAEFMGVDRVVSKVTLLLFFRDLYLRFPTSHYAYAASHVAGGGSLGMLNAVVFQPDNPLNPWAAGAIARSLAYRNRPCATPMPGGPRTPEDLDDRFARVIAAYPPPEPVRAYLRQFEAELAAEECPERKAQPVDETAADRRSGQSGGR